MPIIIGIILSSYFLRQYINNPTGNPMDMTADTTIKKIDNSGIMFKPPSMLNNCIMMLVVCHDIWGISLDINLKDDKVLIKNVGGCL